MMKETYVNVMKAGLDRLVMSNSAKMTVLEEVIAIMEIVSALMDGKEPFVNSKTVKIIVLAMENVLN